MSVPDPQVASSRQLEEAAQNAWPALQQVLFDGWLLRFSGGFTKRANSVTALYAGNRPLESKVRYCENLYARARLQTVFRLADRSDDSSRQKQLDNFLAHRGYRLEDSSLTLIRPLTGAPDTARLRWLTPRAWLRHYARLTGMPTRFERLHGAILKGIQGECGHAALFAADVCVGCALGVTDDNLLGVFDVVVDETHRRQGLASQLLGGLMHWGQAKGASLAWLQVAERNEAGRQLYRKLGFNPAYRYWYRVSN